MSGSNSRRGMGGRDVITVGIFSAIYFAINFAFMLLGGLHPLLLDFDAGLYRPVHRHPIPDDVRQGAEGGFSPADGPYHRADLLRHRPVHPGNPGLLCHCLRPGGTGPWLYPLYQHPGKPCVLRPVLPGHGGLSAAIWLMREDFLRQITEQGMPADYVNTLAALSSSSMLVVLFLALLWARSLAALSPGPCSASTLKRQALSEMERRIFDPRAGLWLLVAANIIAFRPHTLWLELALVGLLLLLMAAHGKYSMAVKWAVGYCAYCSFSSTSCPPLPRLSPPALPFFATYARRMFPCLMTGSLMLKCTPLRYFIVGLRQLRVPQRLIVPSR